jgi:hypothetical protein
VTTYMLKVKTSFNGSSRFVDFQIFKLKYFRFRARNNSIIIKFEFRSSPKFSEEEGRVQTTAKKPRANLATL